MKHGLDFYANLDSSIHRWEPRCKLIGLFSLIFAFSFVEHLSLLPGLLMVTLVYYRLSRLPLSFLRSRLRYPGFFLLTITLLLPFTVGSTVIVQIGILSLYKEGIVALALIATRFLCILTVSLILFGTAPFLSTVKAMRSLGLPAVLADMTLLTYRYIEQFGEDLIKMKRAMQLRGFRATRLSRRNLNVLASLVGSLLVRSYNQSQQVYQAMILRGYGYTLKHRKPPSSINRVSRGDLIAVGITLAIALGFVVAEILVERR
ncbi:MAG: cobalt ECF transporter T component CbiQ [Coleofasciculus sp. G1-WW12-02]|uniref:cobalt ECF transporter T component CbiQ n=1 Tax=Coleofasciculus sp. G1-WW12-02 TaxID=3068483 RepID=UPI0033014089